MSKKSDITRKLVFAENSQLEENKLLYEVIKLTKCDLNTAKSIFQKMKEFGLSVCTNWMMAGYSLRSFAEMRDYATEEELKQRDKEKLERAKREDQREAKFMEKYGTDRSKWSDDVWDDLWYHRKCVWYVLHLVC
ncbi:MAG: hypothetical protein OEM28_07920 [Nitrosopumilus sp.]|nr:hypothetical protein [Nitrosopumilus sp.]MDH3488363.1 hypothetical protein [Nitrosopumilus sp.]